MYTYSFIILIDLFLCTGDKETYEETDEESHVDSDDNVMFTSKYARKFVRQKKKYFKKMRLIQKCKKIRFKKQHL